MALRCASGTEKPVGFWKLLMNQQARTGWVSKVRRRLSTSRPLTVSTGISTARRPRRSMACRAP